MEWVSHFSVTSSCPRLGVRKTQSRNMIFQMAKLESIATAVALLPLALAASTASTSAVNPGSTSTVAGLNVVAQAHGKLYFGTATDNPELTDTAYVANLNNNQQFGQLTAANSMKWVWSHLCTRAW